MNSLLRSALLFALSGGLAFAWIRSARTLYPEMWARRWVRRIAGAAFGIWGLAIVAVPVVRGLDLSRDIRVPVMAVAAVGLVLAGLTVPFLALGAWARRSIERRWPAPEASPPPLPPPSPEESARGWTRRDVALAGARLVPTGGALLAGVGAGAAVDVAQVVELDLSYPDLPPALEGLRILQYSDVHLGYFIDLDEIESLVAQGQNARADLVVLTGDIADDLAQLPRALELFQSLKPKHGVYASIGNHEYFRGIAKARKAYDASGVPLLLESGHTIDAGGARLHISGADDPRYLGRQNSEFFQRTIATTLDGAPSDAFHVLLSHRPEGFAAAREVGVELTLAGHTHGTQLGNGARSIFESLLPEKYLWGPYEKDGSRLYTSSGAGHWFPFRLGCPRELPVIRLVRGPLGQAVAKRRIA